MEYIFPCVCILLANFACMASELIDTMHVTEAKKDLKNCETTHIEIIGLIITESLFPVHEFQIYLNTCTLCITALILSASKQCHVRLLLATSSCIQLYSLNNDYF